MRERLQGLLHQREETRPAYQDRRFRSWLHESALTYALATCSISENNTLQYKYIQSILAGIIGIDVHQDVLIH